MSYEVNRAWSDRFIPRLKYLIGPQLLEVSSFDVDTQQAADLVVMRAKDQMIAARVRRHGYAERYPYEFTVRSALDSGAKTELSKMVDGFGDWMFYGHASADDQDIERWWLIDLHAWRAALIRNRGDLTMYQKSNHDGTHFVSFDLRSFPPRPSILIGSSHPLPRLRVAA